ncbi:uncharacterized protein B0I36DRAFT_333783 [Microdochium trichocladiopsis]|uniref:Kinesin light chain n=1 Tax=Microdochium trichocladiopsis TaxID=1682393 RepID=A0A9P9BI10_9PEZI|nr:uncharacterized protein B0I36DRAFT_333783 [Microdochium trichocladiopsis]KAH7021100.1 hypothetical protein B0I36DRAFT_333783 [Microdochium trichocladiopsis]
MPPARNNSQEITRSAHLSLRCASGNRVQRPAKRTWHAYVPSTMRLLRFDADRLVLTDFAGATTPPYAILSHRWTDDEVLFEDITNNTAREKKAGWRKIEFCAQRAADDGLDYFWIDSCCIDKWNQAERSRSVNSMFKWYQNAAKCYVFLRQVNTTTQPLGRQETTWEQEFRDDEWFTRGWTLQELIAPSSVEFFDSQGRRLGDRVAHRQLIHAITGIPLRALDGHLGGFSQADRLKWAEGRITTEPEDGAYCLLGILGVEMPLTYGEGRQKAFLRLKEELDGPNRAPCLIPFWRNDCFVGHEVALHELDQKLLGDQNTRIVAILGDGGLGKSHLALEFAYKTRDKMPGCSVFWIDASSTDSLHESYSEIARKLRLSSDESQPAKVMTAVDQYLSSKEAGGWLLIYDNADETSLIPTLMNIKQSTPSTQCLASSQMRSVLVTTRNSHVASQVCDEFMHMAELGVASSAAMLQAYLANHIPAKHQQAAILQLAEVLRRPLAIVIAAAYLRVQGITVDEYVIRMKTWHNEREIEEDDEVSPAISPRTASEDQSVNAATHISLSQIMNDDPLAAESLFRMACLHRTDIPLVLLDCNAEGKIEDRMALLRNYALITRRPASTAVDVHDLVHRAVRRWINRNGQGPYYQGLSQLHMLAVFPRVDDNSRTQWRRLLPHARHMLAHFEGEETESRDKLRARCADALALDWRFNDAEELDVQVLEFRRRTLGQDHLDTLLSMSALARTLLQQGRWGESEGLLLQALERSKRIRGQDHPNTLLLMSDLALAIRNQGRWDEAEGLQLQVLESSKRIHGQDHPTTLAIMSNLTSTLFEQGRLDEAEELQVQIVESSKQLLGQDHPTTLATMSNLALTLFNKGRLDEAEELGRQVWDSKKRILGQNHPDTLIAVSILALILCDKGRLEEAEVLGRQVLESSQRIRGPDNPNTLGCIHNLALIFWEQGRLEEAERLQVQAMGSRQRALGQDHPDTLATMYSLAETFWLQGRADEAISLLEKCLLYRQRRLGATHPKTTFTREKLEQWQAESHEPKDQMA